MAKRKSFMNALKWAYVMNWGTRGFSALFMVVLAAILGPRDFGTVSIAAIYIGFLQMFLDQGFVAALIQRKELDHEHFDAVFWMDQVLSVVLVGVSVLLSGWWAAKNHSPEVAMVISVLSLSIPIQGLAAVQGAILNREMDFKSLSIRSNAAAIVGGLVGIGMAIAGYRYWSLVGQQLARDCSALVLLWRLSHWRPRFSFSWKHLRDLMGFSTSNFIGQLAIYADMQAASVLLGLFFGPVAVGLYRIAERVTGSVVTVAMASIQSVSFPEFARFQDNQQELHKSGLTCIRLSSATSLPALAGLAAVSGPLMATVGANWVPAANVVQILSFLGMLMIFAYFTGPLLQALAKPRLFAVLEWARVAVGTVLLVVAGVLVKNGSVSMQVAGIAGARFVAGAFLVTPVFVYIFLRFCKISLREFTATIAPSVLASASVLGSVMLFHSTGWLSGARPVYLLAAEVLVGGLVGSAVLYRLDGQIRSSVSDLVQRTFARRLLSKKIDLL